MKNQGSSHRSFLGREVDMHRLVMEHEMAIAVGNIKVNARGDELGPGGQIVSKKEEVISRKSQIPTEIKTAKVETPVQNDNIKKNKTKKVDNDNS